MRIFILVFSIAAFSVTATAQMFVNVNTGVPGLANRQSLDWGDCDNDGDLDLLIAGQLVPPDLSPVCKIFKYENHAFSEENIPLQAKYHPNVKFCDYDSDGDLDYFVSGADTYWGTISTFIVENSDGNFNMQKMISSKGGLLDCGDLDQDGDIDVLVSGTDYNPGLFIARNDCSNGVFEFTDVLLPSLPVKFSTAALADLDDDNDLDIIISGEGEEIADYHVQILQHDSALSYTLVDISLPQIRGFISTADYDNDNDQDILITGIHNYNVPITTILRNDNNWNFTVITEALPQVNGVSAFADVNNDGYADVILAGISGEYPDFISVTSVMKNNGNETFTATDAVSLPLNAGSLATGDYDADGDIDFAISGGDTFLEPDYHTLVYANSNILSDEKESASHVLLYPNPVADVLKIILTKPAKELTISLFNASGQLLKMSKYDNCTSAEDDLSNLSHGVYVLIIKTETDYRSYKIIR